MKNKIINKVFLYIGSAMPLLAYMDFVLEIQLLRDFGHIKTAGFSLCLGFMIYVINKES